MRNLVAIAFLVLFNSFLVGCSSFPKSTKEMWARSGYEGEEAVKEGKVFSGKKKKAVKIYVGAMMLPSGDYFQEGVIQMVIDEKELIFDDPYLKSLR